MIINKIKYLLYAKSLYNIRIRKYVQNDDGLILFEPIRGVVTSFENIN